MATVRFYLDTRATAGDESKTAPLKIAVCHRGSTSYINLNVSLLPSQWDAERSKVVRHTRQQSVNAMLKQRLLEVESAIFKVSEHVSLKALTATKLRDCITHVIAQRAAPAPALQSVMERQEKPGRSFISVFDENMSMKSPGNQRVIRGTRNRLVAWLGEKALAEVSLEDVTLKWISDFEKFLSLTCKSANTLGLHVRNIRAAINYAIDNELLTKYVFRRVKIPKEPTRKRNMKVEVLRKVFFAQGLEPSLERYRDMFMLMFMLRGINFVDLCYLQGIEDGRIEYVRAKTHKKYSIKVEPEMLYIINKYRGKKYLLDYMDTHGDYRSFYQVASLGLRRIKAVLNQRRDGLPVKGLSTYWSRHSWATIAASIDIPFDTIMAGLGHGGSTVTDVYIERDPAKVDTANRRILDWVLYGKDYREESR